MRLRIGASAFTASGWETANRKGIETLTKVWEKVIVDRCADLKSWVDYLQPVKKRGEIVYVYANNHYAGYSPATAASFLKLWEAAE